MCVLEGLVRYQEVASIVICIQQVLKSKFFYSAVSNPQDCSKRFTLSFPDRPVQLDTISNSLGSMLQLMREGCSYTCPPLFIAMYSFIELSELE